MQTHANQTERTTSTEAETTQWVNDCMTECYND